MIRESLYFSFANRKSSDFGIYNVSVADGLFEEEIAAVSSINEVYVRGKHTPYFVNKKKEPITLTLKFAFLDKYNDDLIDEVIRWLNVDFYEPLFFEGDIDRVYYCMPVDGIQHIHNGLKEGYLNLTMRCDSPFSYSHDIVSPWYECRPEVGGTFVHPYQWIELGIKGRTSIEVYNNGHHDIYPEIFIKKVGDGDVTIHNITNKNQEFKFTDLVHGEKVYVDCEHEYIESDKEDVYRNDYFNDNYLELVYGKNLLVVKGTADIKFRYRYIYG